MPPLSAQLLYSRSAYLGTSRCGHRPSLIGEGSLEGLRFDSMVKVGAVWTTIADAIEEKRSGLLVLGTHGRTGIRKLALGSVAECAFREAPCPVMTVGPRVLQSKSCGAEAKHFLVPTDLSPQSMNALPYGISLARATGGDVTLLYVRRSRSGSNDQDAQAVVAANVRLRELLQTHPDTRPIAPFIVKTGPPDAVVVAFAEEQQMDLIVMGRRAWSEDSRPMWRTAYAIVTQAACPVLSMRSATALEGDAVSST